MSGGGESLLSVAEASEMVLALAHPLSVEDVSLTEAAGRYLARPLRAERDQPPFDASSMDGYAIGGTPSVGSRFRVIGEASAGHALGRRIGPGEASRIFTGAPLPQGANCVIVQEDVRRDGDDITIMAIRRNPNIRLRGQDYIAGATIEPRRLSPADIGLLAAMNHAAVPVFRRPVVAIIPTGDELVWPGEIPRADQIIASNGFVLKPLVESAGAVARLLPIARDNEPALTRIFNEAEGADIIVTIGGASVGDHDLVGRIAARLGFQQSFWKIALRPGKPLMAGRLGRSAMIGLPGNPGASIVCGHLFLLPLIRVMQGDPSPLPRPRQARLSHDLPENGWRAHYMSARITDGDLIDPFATQDSGFMATLAASDALLIRPPNDPPRKAGEICAYLPI